MEQKTVPSGPDKLPTLTTARLLLRPFTQADAPRVTALAGDRKIYETTLAIPHPYHQAMAEAWIATHAAQYREGRGLVLAAVLKGTGELIGAAGLEAAPAHSRAELGYWIGVPYWGNGYCTEAAGALIRHAFAAMEYHRITARHMTGNPASGRVMRKTGMQHEGTLRDHACKDGVFHTVEVYGLLNPA